MSAGELTRQARAALISSGLGQAAEETNTAELLDKAFRVTRMGEGGLPSARAIPLESRAVQPSYLGFIDPVRTPESMNAGVDMSLAGSVRRGPDGQAYVRFTDAKTGEPRWVTPRQAVSMAIAMPGQNTDRPTAQVMSGGRLRRVPWDRVDVIAPDSEEGYGPLSNMVPMKSATKGQRISMAARMIAQALPLTNAESPLVQTAVPGHDGLSYERKYGTMLGAVEADTGGVVRSVGPDRIELMTPAGPKTIELHQNLPMNRRTFFHQTPVVQPGQRIEPGQLLARSNYTNDRGEKSLGMNLRTAFMPMRGLNHEDAVVISQSAANRFTSEHAYQSDLDLDPNLKLGRAAYRGLFPDKFNDKQFQSLDKDGVVLPGTTVQQGDPLIVAASPSQARPGSRKTKGLAHSDASLVWDHQHEGVVTDVAKTGKGYSVVVQAKMPAITGTKLSGRAGNKGIAVVLPDESMPKDEDGQPFELLLSPGGLVSRTNDSQVFEALLGKIAAKTGKPYMVPGFLPSEHYWEYVQRELDKHGVKDSSSVIDPDTGQKIDGVLTGSMYMMKLYSADPMCDKQTWLRKYLRAKG